MTCWHHTHNLAAHMSASVVKAVACWSILGNTRSDTTRFCWAVHCLPVLVCSLSYRGQGWRRYHVHRSIFHSIPHHMTQFITALAPELSLCSPSCAPLTTSTPALYCKVVWTTTFLTYWVITIAIDRGIIWHMSLWLGYCSAIHSCYCYHWFHFLVNGSGSGQ